MANALSDVGGSPPVPNPDPEPPMGSPGMGNALAPPPAGQPAGGGPQQQQPQQPPAPTHQQTVAALRHFSAIERELSALLADPDIGKADLKSKIIDGATKLVAEQILTPGEAVQQLGAVPDGKVPGGPFRQKQWIEQNFAQTIQGADAVLSQHGAAFAGQPDQPGAAPSPQDHQQIMSGLMQHYKSLGYGNA